VLLNQIVKRRPADPEQLYWLPSIGAGLRES